MGINDNDNAMALGLGVGFGSFIGGLLLLCICWHFCCGKVCSGADEDNVDNESPNKLFSKMRRKKLSGKVAPKNDKVVFTSAPKSTLKDENNDNSNQQIKTAVTLSANHPKSQRYF